MNLWRSTSCRPFFTKGGDAACLAQWWCGGSGVRSGRYCLWVADFHFLCRGRGFSRTRCPWDSRPRVEGHTSILLRELLECHRPCIVPIDAVVVTHFPEPSSFDEGSVTTETKVDGDLLERHALRADSAALIFKLLLAYFTMWQEVSTKLLFLDRQQLHCFKKRQHFEQDSLGAPFK